MNENTPNAEPGGLSRRDMLRRSALVGGALVWTVPAVQTLASPAFAAGSPTGGGGGGTGLSEVTLLLNCGGTYSWAKYLPQSANGVAGVLAPSECKAGMNVGESGQACDPPGATTCCTSAPDPGCCRAEADLYTAGGSGATGTCLDGVVSASGELCINVGTCTIVGWTIHDGFAGSDRHCAHAVNGVLDPNSATTGYSVTQTGSTICFAKTV
jgi:hypothetical protein